MADTATVENAAEYLINLSVHDAIKETLVTAENAGRLLYHEIQRLRERNEKGINVRDVEIQCLRDDNKQLAQVVKEWQTDNAKLQVELDLVRQHRTNLQKAVDQYSEAMNATGIAEFRYIKNIHDELVRTLLPEVLRIATSRIDAARSVNMSLFTDDDSFRAAVITEARALADAAMKAREVTP